MYIYIIVTLGVMKSDTDSSDSEGEFIADYEMFDGSIQLYSFEPEYTTEEMRQREEAESNLRHNIQQQAEGNTAIDWCNCDMCV